MSRKRTSEPDPVREGIAQAMREIAEAGGVVLVGRAGQPFAFYPQHARDPCAPERLRKLVEWRLMSEDERRLEDELLFESLDPKTLAEAP